MALQLNSPIGRLVQGNAFTPNDTDQQGAPLVVKTGPNAGQRRSEWFIAIAVRKDDPAWPAFYAQIVAEGAAAWPTLFPHGARADLPNGGCTIPSFAWKITDGDGYDTRGVHNGTKEGFAGCWVLKLSSGYAPKVFAAGAYDPIQQVTDPARLKLGFYCRAALSVKSNENQQKPGLYLNMSLIEISGFGPEIITGPSASAAFGAAPAALPPGASATPVAPGPTPPAAVAPPVTPAYSPPVGMPAGGAPSPSASGPPAPTPVSPSNPPPPTHTGYMTAPPPAPAAPAPPPAPVAPPPPAAAPAWVTTAKALPHSYEQMVAAGWTHQQLVDAGMVEYR